MHKAILIILTFFGIIHSALCQSTFEIDELNRRAEVHVNQNVDSAIALADQALELSVQIDYYRGESVALSHLGFSYYIRGEYDKAVEYSTRGIDIGEKHNVRDGLERAYQV